MVELRDLYLKMGELLKANEDFAVVTVVRTEGSTPRKPGAKMIVRRDGSIYGTIGGGPVERTAVEEALKAISDGKPRLLSFRLEEGEEGMVCGGNMDVFIEPVVSSFKVLIVGGGHIGKTLAKMASLAGLSTLMVEPRIARDEIPAETFLIAKDYVEGLSQLPIDGKTLSLIHI